MLTTTNLYPTDILLENELFDKITKKFKNIRFLEDLTSKLKNDSNIYKKKLQRLEKSLKDKSIDIDLIRSSAEKRANKIYTKYKPVLSKAQTNNIILTEIELFEIAVMPIAKNFSNDIKTQIKEFFGIKDKLDPAKFTKDTMVAVVLFGLLIFISVFLSNILVLILGPWWGRILAICLVLPLIEEYSKYISVELNNAGQFLIVFNIVEFFGYVLIFYIAGIPLLTIISLRIAVVIMHSITTYILFKTNREKGNMNVAFLCAFLIHAIWNTGAVLIPFF